MAAKHEIQDEIENNKEGLKYVQEEEVYRPDVDTSGIDEKKLIRKVDWHVIPWLALLYLLNSLDRGNIGNAKVRQWPRLVFIRLISIFYLQLYNLEHDLSINDNQYLIALTVFFFPYSLFEARITALPRRAYSYPTKARE
jgi:hypothetical protein